MHWDWLWGYRFFKADLLEVSDAAVRRMFEVHVGSIGCTGDPAGDPATTCKRGNRNEVRLEGFDPDRSVVVADLAALFAGSNLMLGPDGTVCRSGSDTECSAVFTSLGIDFQTGEPLLTQSVFRVESP